MNATKPLNKVAEITVYFWLMKILATTLGETFGDHLSMTLNIGYLVSLFITMVFFLVVLVFQVATKKFHASLFWLVIVSTTTVGTEISDFMDRSLGLGYALGSLILFTGMVFILLIWHRQEKGITIYPITKRSTELYFWLVVLFSNSLGTAFGDLLSDNFGLSYAVGALVTAGIIGIVLVLHYATKINAVLLFWIAFIFTRPFGATFGDLLTKPVNKGGLDLGTIPASLVTALLLVFFLLLSSRKRSNVMTR